MSATIIRFPGAPEPPITEFEFAQAIYSDYIASYTGKNIGELTGDINFSTVVDFEVARFINDPEYGDVDANRRRDGGILIVTGPNFPETLRMHADIDRKTAIDMAAVYVTAFGIMTSATKRLGIDER